MVQARGRVASSAPLKAFEEALKRLQARSANRISLGSSLVRSLYPGTGALLHIVNRVVF